MGGGLDGKRKFERDTRRQDQVERAVLLVHGDQPVEREQAREQRAEPQDGRADPGQQREIGADGERHQRHDDQEEQYADQRTAADPHGEPQIAQEQCGQRGHDGCLDSGRIPHLVGSCVPSPLEGQGQGGG